MRAKNGVWSKGVAYKAGMRNVTWFLPFSQPIFTTFLNSFVSARAVWGASSCLQVSPRKLAWGSPGLGCVRVSPVAILEEDLGTEGSSTGRAPGRGSWGVEDSHRCWGRQPLPSGSSSPLGLSSPKPMTPSVTTRKAQTSRNPEAVSKIGCRTPQHRQGQENKARLRKPQPRVA